MIQSKTIIMLVCAEQRAVDFGRFVPYRRSAAPLCVHLKSQSEFPEKLSHPSKVLCSHGCGDCPDMARIRVPTKANTTQMTASCSGISTAVSKRGFLNKTACSEIAAMYKDTQKATISLHTSKF